MRHFLAGLLAFLPATAWAGGPTSSGGGGVVAGSCTGGQYISAISSGASPTCGTPTPSVQFGPNYISGYYSTFFGTAPRVSPTTASSTRCTMGLASKSFTISAISVRITTASAGGGVVQAIYSNNPTTNKPYQYLTGFNTPASTSSATTLADISVTALAVSAGTAYWLCTVMDQGTSAMPATFSQAFELMGAPSNANIPSNNTGFNGYTLTTTYSTITGTGWPADATSAISAEISAAVPTLYYRVQ